MNGIAVQAKVYGPYLPATELPCIEKNKQRSVSVEHEELEVYVAGARVGPQCLVTSESYLQESQKAAEVAARKTCCGSQQGEVIKIIRQSQAGLGSISEPGTKVLISEDVVGYLPTINAPATEMNTVFEILNRSELIRKELLVETIVVVMDQALYAKAAEIIWKQGEQYSNIVLRMGTFHTICNAFSILGKRFGDAGLKDIMHRGWISC